MLSILLGHYTSAIKWKGRWYSPQSGVCCLDGAFIFFIPRSKYQINICNSILHYRELMVFGAMVIGGILSWWSEKWKMRKVFIFNSSPNVEDKGGCKWVSVDCHQSSLQSPGPRPGRDIGAKAPYPSCVISRTHPGPAPGAQFLCSNLSSLLRASLSLLFFVQSQLGYTTGGIGATNVLIMSGSCSDIGSGPWCPRRSWPCHKGCVTLTQ